VPLRANGPLGDLVRLTVVPPSSPDMILRPF